MSVKVTVLGCGNSTGVPAIGNYWGQCDPQEPKNMRTRSSICVQSGVTSLVIDTGPDFRAQVNRENIAQIDAVFYTHAHSDHVNGIDELRVLRFRSGALVPVYSNHKTIEELQVRFGYMFDGGKSDIYPQMVDAYSFKDEDFGSALSIGDIQVTPFIQDHGTVDTVGYRFGDFAYSVDMLDLNDKAINALKGVKTWLVDCAGFGHDKNPVHANFDKILKLNAQIGAERVYLTSLSLGADYQNMVNILPEGYKPAYDGLVLP